MTFSAEFLLQLVIAMSSGAGVYAALRADLARLHERSMQQAQEIQFLRNHIVK